MSEVVFRKYRDGDEYDIVKLLDVVFSGWPGFDLECSNIDHWFWKFKENHLKKNFITVAVLDGEIIGVREAIYLNYWIGSSFYKGWVGYDVAVHPEHQGKGVFSGMIKYSETLPDYLDRDFAVTASENPIMKARDRKDGFIPFPKKIYRYAKIKDIVIETRDQQLLNRIQTLLGFHVLKHVNQIGNLFRKQPDSLVQIYPVDRFDEKFIPFVSKMYKKHDFIFERSLDYLNWRYCDIRGGKYRVFVAEIEDNIVGYIVCRVSKSREEKVRGHIVDLLVDPDYQEAAYSLLRRGIEYIEDYKVNRVIAWVIRDHWLERVFSFYGFLNSYREVGVVVGSQDIGNDKKKMLEAASNRLHIQIGDTDWI